MSGVEDLAHLAEQAGHTRVAVVGGGIAGLIAAMECARVGLQVTVFEASDRLGGVLRSAEIAGLTVDVGAESFATRGGHVRALIDELDLSDAVASPNPVGAWVAGLPTGAAPLPGGSVLGIPDNPWREDVRRILGWSGAWRAYVDRLRPPLTIGHDRSLGHLVRKRMGQRVLDRLVAPVTTGVYSARPDDIDVDLAAPGLNAALTRTGSLSGAVADLVGGRQSAPGGAVQGLAGGMTRLVEALSARLLDLGVDIRVNTSVTALTETPTGWGLTTDGAVTEGAEEFTAVIVAVTEPEARALLSPVVSALEAETAAAPEVELITLVIDAPELDTHPRGTGVLTVPNSHVAKALTHSTAKWPWLDALTESGTHVVRVSFGAQGEVPATAELNDTDAVALAVAEASALLGVALHPQKVRGWHRDSYVQSQPAATRGRPEAVAAARGAIRAVSGLGAVGAWISGTGLAQVVPDAIAESDRVRRAALWGRGAQSE
ncbi:oxygen-dependent protoporphyrinogen oxidase [Microbacterium endophyticum]|uniref:Coproporphyrinogen III oxidase n=1 Tax=Microbacterium endophyticum TaxID=1526412 RepID=A0A7W4YLS9_9MICO|nr:protoporphyrinogen oxidase [Microbacterium endophyticum]MBB2975745.1 oxygen-dependent protoporphyrinogen oxidase [Microbacterium endophyticum]NIK36228.1 oxygen-dependent protoporphyrinogen oxidase [Microbacterium endophyticum]